MELTTDIDKQIKSIAYKMTNNYDDRQDCIQEGRLRVLEMDEGFKPAYYVTGAKWAMQNYLKKERLNRGETKDRIILPIGQHLSESISEDDFHNSRLMNGNDTLLDRGGKRDTSYNPDDYDPDHFSEVDRFQEQ
jgi:DNA-directed RNA polymerase specialized sigma24 family protein